MDLRTAAVLLGGVLLRIAPSILFPGIHAVLASRVELATPASSYKQLREGLYLYDLGMAPYDGGVYHQAPLLLPAFTALGQITSLAPSALPIAVLYAALDTLTAYFLSKISLSRKQLQWLPAAVFMFNPVVLATTLARSTTTISHAALTAAVACATAGAATPSVLLLALAGHVNAYFCYLAVPLCVLWATTARGRAASLGLFAAASAGLSYTGFLLTGASPFSFPSAVLMLKFLTPNMGMWWYFFIEMFDFFRPLFTYIFQLYSAIYVVPVTLRLRREPLFALACIHGITTMSKAYPELGDLGMYISILALYQDIFEHVPGALLSALVILHALVLAPSFYYLWIYLGSGNANFFYAVTLVYAIGLTILIKDTLRAVLRREFEAVQGVAVEGAAAKRAVVQI
ncbi:GPI transamidase subunit PIG-U [Limtongia smithiae]|uniref:GPI transamidase subunit PIG-U n=1 Tax=Limtongia smithiae TaxID=1125753 RepID=UPI0034CF2E0B